MAIVRFDAIREISAASVTNSYQALGNPIDQNWRVMKISNNTDGDMKFSANGSADNIFVPAGGFVLFDFATNAQNVKDTDWFVLRLGTQIYVKYVTAPTTGSIYVEGIYSTGT